MQACIINIYIIYVWYLIIPFLINKYFSIYYEFGNYILYKKNVSGVILPQLLIVDIAFFKILFSAARSSRLFSLAATREDHVALNFSTSVAYFKSIIIDVNNKIVDSTSLLQ